MELDHLRHFQTVARLEHMSQAANELGIAQPSLSRSIARLEADLGVPLFDRLGRRLRLNRFGTAYRERVDAALRELDSGRRELLEFAGLSRGSVAVAVETLRTITELLAAFLAEEPEAKFRLYQSSAPVMLRQLQAGEVDMCLASQPLEGPQLRTLELRSEEVFLTVPPKHPLAERTSVTIGEVASERFVITRTGHWQRALFEHLFRDQSQRPPIACEGDEAAAASSLVSAGLGVSLLPAVARRALSEVPVAWVRVQHPDCRRTLRLVWRENAHLSQAAQRFREVVVARLGNSGSPAERAEG